MQTRPKRAHQNSITGLYRDYFAAKRYSGLSKIKSLAVDPVAERFCRKRAAANISSLPHRSKIAYRKKAHISVQIRGEVFNHFAPDVKAVAQVVSRRDLAWLANIQLLCRNSISLSQHKSRYKRLAIQFDALSH